MREVKTRVISKINIYNGREYWEVSLVWNSDNSRIDLFSINKVAVERFGLGNYELLDKGNCWRLVAPSIFEQVSSLLSNNKNGVQLLGSMLVEDADLAIVRFGPDPEKPRN